MFNNKVLILGENSCSAMKLYRVAHAPNTLDKEHHKVTYNGIQVSLSELSLSDLEDMQSYLNTIVAEKRRTVYSPTYSSYYVGARNAGKTITLSTEFSKDAEKQLDAYKRQINSLYGIRATYGWIDDATDWIKANPNCYKISKLELFGEKELNNVWINEKKKLVTTKNHENKLIKVKCDKRDEFDPYVGAALAYAYKQFGSKTKFRKAVDKLLAKEKK